MKPSRHLLRRKRTWAIAAFVILYTIAGFFIAPPVIKRQIVERGAKELGRAVEVDAVRCNPYNLSLSLRGFVLKDPDGTVFVAFDELYVNFQASSLFRRAYTFKELRLDSLRIHVRLMKDGKLNFADVVEKVRSRRGAAAVPARRRTAPRVVIGDFQLNGARFLATNLQPAEPQVVGFTPVTFRLSDFSTMPNREGDYVLRATGPFGGLWNWRGRLGFDPPSINGTFSIDGTNLRRIWEIVKNQVNFEIVQGRLGLSIDYSVVVRDDTVTASIARGSLALDRFSLRQKGRESDLLSLDSLRVSGMSLRYPEREASIERVLVGGAEAIAWLTPSRDINWLSVFQPFPADQAGASAVQRGGTAPGERPSAEADTSSVPARLPWTVGVADVLIDNLSFTFRDSTTTPPFSIEIDTLDLALRGISSKPGAEFGLDAKVTIEGTGKLSVEGIASALPRQARVKAELSDLPLPVFQPYVRPIARLEIVRGTIGGAGEIEISDIERGAVPGVRFTGSANVKDFAVVDSKQHENLVTWRSLELSGISYAPEENHVSDVKSTGAYARIIVYPDRTTNLAAVFPRRAPKDTTGVDSTGGAPPLKKRSSSPRVPTTIDVVRIVHCQVDFSDLSLVLPFSANIHSLQGEVRGLSSDELARAEVSLDGSVKPSGSVIVRGNINPLRGDLYTDLSVLFKDFDLPALTPYSGNFAGREIEKGKMMLDLKYQVSQREILGQNKIVLDQLELGRKIESPDATSLPVGLAVALLKNRDGVIDLDIPVEGNLDDPKFSIRDVIIDVLLNIVTKAVTAPFSLLGKLVGFGGDSEEMSYVDFEPGSRRLEPSELEKVAKLGAALNERPELRLSIRGGVHPENDSKAIRQQKFDALVTGRIQQNPKKYGVAEGAAYPVKLLRDLYAEQFGKDAVEPLEDRFQVPKIGEDGKPKGGTALDEAAFRGEIERALTDLQTVSEIELTTLAVDRAVGIKETLVRTSAVDPTRLFLLDVDDRAESKEGKVRLALELSD